MNPFIFVSLCLQCQKAAHGLWSDQWWNQALMTMCNHALEKMFSNPEDDDILALLYESFIPKEINFNVPHGAIFM